MTLLLPQALLSLLLIPLFTALYVVMQRRRQRYALRYASVSLVREAVGRGPGLKRHIPPAMFLLALAALALGLARPQVTQAVAQSEGTVVLSVDVSGSMLATDVEPDRMGATKAALREFVNEQPEGIRVGLVTFTDFASIVQPPTADKAQMLAAIGRLQTQRGTNIGAGLQVALDALQVAASAATTATASGSALPDAEAPPRAAVRIVLLSDGESNTGPPPIQLAEEAAAAGIKVDTVGIGTAAGAYVTNVVGQRVLTRLDESTLQSVAEATGGRYLNAQDEAELMQVYEDLAREQRVELKTTEITVYAVAGAMALSVLGAGLSLAWFNRLP
jgi:Ca-activated chloride channel homolog